MKATTICRRPQLPRLTLAFVAAATLAVPVAEARITRIEIDAARSQSPTFGGYSWPEVGQYEKVVGKAYGEVNPRDRQNRVIVDIEFAPRNARGNVESQRIAISDTGYLFSTNTGRAETIVAGSSEQRLRLPAGCASLEQHWTAFGRIHASGQSS